MHNSETRRKDLHETPLVERAEELISRAKHRLAPVDSFIRTQVQERPLVVLAVALGLGYLAGRMIRRI